MSELGRYKVVRTLGRGGQAEVLEGVLEGAGGFRRRVAIKRLLPELQADHASARMFLDEARIGSQLSHENVVSVLDFGEADGVPFQILELVDGSDLERLLWRARERGLPLPEPCALYVALQVARGLHAAHEATDHEGRPLGIVHRDVSPANVLVARDGRVKLTDFGIAMAAGRLERTAGAMVKGKLAYMAPEQATRGRVDRRCDVFALGCVLHTLLVGESPIADLADLTGLALGGELAMGAALHGPVRALLQRALMRQPAQRFQTAAELADALAARLADSGAVEPARALGAWVEAVSGPSAAPFPAQAPLMDALFALPEVGGGREVGARGREGAGSSPAPEAEPATAPSSAPGARRSGLRVAALLAVLLPLPVALWARWGPPSEAARDSAAAGSAAPLRGPAAPRAPGQGGDPARAPEPNPPDAPGTTAEQPAQSARHGRRRPASARRTPAAPAEGTGTLAIGGPGARRARIAVDGKPAGFAPKRLLLSVGTHDVTLSPPDAAALSRSVLIGPEHTDSAPLRWLLP